MKASVTLFFVFLVLCLNVKARQQQPNIVIIYADDLGYGDVGANGATKIKTPNMDKIALGGIRFTNAHSSSATCTPSRFSLLTGMYAWRQNDTRIAPGDAAAIIKPGTALPGMLQRAGYQTAAVGKWHLGLGPEGGPDWNGEIKPGPLEIGFNYCFVMPATGDRVPTVYLENHRIVNLDPEDPIEVSYKGKVGNEPTGKENPELLTMKSNLGHDNTIVNGIGRIGYMSGGKAARWVDSDIANVITGKAVDFIKANKAKPFFLYLATNDIHVPHVTASKFFGKSGLGLRGDAILQLDWTVGEVLRTLEKLKLTENTIIVLSSDNGPAIEDAYDDGGYRDLNGHTPSGPYRGGKYSLFEAGTRVPFFISWRGKIKTLQQSDALVSQMDLFSSFAKLTGIKLEGSVAPDSREMLDVLMGQSRKGREYLVEHNGNIGFGVISGDWKYIDPRNGPKYNQNKIELGNDKAVQLYHLKSDPEEQQNVAAQHPDIVQKMQERLKAEMAKNKVHER
jgi:arylsulfatase A-like enzyme